MIINRCLFIENKEFFYDKTAVAFVTYHHKLD